MARRLVMIAIGRVEVYFARERTRQNLDDVALITDDEGAIRESDADRRNFGARLRGSTNVAWKLNKSGHFRGFLALATFPSELSTIA